MAGAVAAGLSKLAGSTVGLRVHPIRASTVIKANPATINLGFMVCSYSNLRAATRACYLHEGGLMVYWSTKTAGRCGHLNSAVSGYVSYIAQEL
jgi:hypothetical protein